MSQVQSETDVLRTIPFLADLTESQLSGVLARGRIITFRPDEAIVERGEPGRSLFVVMSGRARVEAGGRYHDLKRGDFLGEMSVLSSKPRMRTVKAVEPLKALEIQCEDIDAFLRENPAVALHMLRVMAERLREVEERLDAWMGVYVT